MRPPEVSFAQAGYRSVLAVSHSFPYECPTGWAAALCIPVPRSTSREAGVGKAAQEDSDAQSADGLTEIRR
jgi:hypothetical protein